MRVLTGDVQIFVVSNQGGEDETRIDSIDIFGMPLQYVPPFETVCRFSVLEAHLPFRGTRDVSGLKKVEDE